ncbi:MAG: hypothetical protein H0U10_00830, partial [Chloroflexia bacterium]|nr:hypothetical protein [Chloroflexia bacterium]
MRGAAAARQARSSARQADPRRRVLFGLYAAPFAALLALGGLAGGQARQTQQAMAAAYERGDLAAAGGDHVAAIDAFAAAGTYADAPARHEAANAVVAPARAAYLDGVASLEAGNYA